MEVTEAGACRWCRQRRPQGLLNRPASCNTTVPKLQALRATLEGHLLRKAEAGQAGRAIIFTATRASVDEILGFIDATYGAGAVVDISLPAAPDAAVAGGAGLSCYGFRGETCPTAAVGTSAGASLPLVRAAAFVGQARSGRAAAAARASATASIKAAAAAAAAAGGCSGRGAGAGRVSNSSRGGARVGGHGNARSGAHGCSTADDDGDGDGECADDDDDEGGGGGDDDDDDGDGEEAARLDGERLVAERARMIAEEDLGGGDTELASQVFLDDVCETEAGTDSAVVAAGATLAACGDASSTDAASFASAPAPAEHLAIAMRGQNQREQSATLAAFRGSRINVLVATCIGEEGLDIGEVGIIIMYDAVKSPIRIVQRLGRTGRSSAGECVALVSEKEAADLTNSFSLYRKIADVLRSGGSAGGRTDIFGLYKDSPLLVGADPDAVRRALAAGGLGGQAAHGSVLPLDQALARVDNWKAREAAAAARVASGGGCSAVPASSNSSNGGASASGVVNTSLTGSAAAFKAPPVLVGEVPRCDSLPPTTVPLPYHALSPMPPLVAAAFVAGITCECVHVAVQVANSSAPAAEALSADASAATAASSACDPVDADPRDAVGMWTRSHALLPRMMRHSLETSLRPSFHASQIAGMSQGVAAAAASPAARALPPPPQALPAHARTRAAAMTAAGAAASSLVAIDPGSVVTESDSDSDVGGRASVRQLVTAVAPATDPAGVVSDCEIIDLLSQPQTGTAAPAAVTERALAPTAGATSAAAPADALAAEALSVDIDRGAASSCSNRSGGSIMRSALPVHAGVLGEIFYTVSALRQEAREIAAAAAASERTDAASRASNRGTVSATSSASLPQASRRSSTAAVSTGNKRLQSVATDTAVNVPTDGISPSVGNNVAFFEARSQSDAFASLIAGADTVADAGRAGMTGAFRVGQAGAGTDSVAKTTEPGTQVSMHHHESSCAAASYCTDVGSVVTASALRCPSGSAGEQPVADNSNAAAAAAAAAISSVTAAPLQKLAVAPAPPLEVDRVPACSAAASSTLHSPSQLPPPPSVRAALRTLFRDCKVKGSDFGALTGRDLSGYLAHLGLDLPADAVQPERATFRASVKFYALQLLSGDIAADTLTQQPVPVTATSEPAGADTGGEDERAPVFARASKRARVDCTVSHRAPPRRPLSSTLPADVGGSFVEPPQSSMRAGMAQISADGYGCDSGKDTSSGYSSSDLVEISPLPPSSPAVELSPSQVIVPHRRHAAAPLEAASTAAPSQSPPSNPQPRRTILKRPCAVVALSSAEAAGVGASKIVRRIRSHLSRPLDPASRAARARFADDEAGEVSGEEYSSASVDSEGVAKVGHGEKEDRRMPRRGGGDDNDEEYADEPYDSSFVDDSNIAFSTSASAAALTSSSSDNSGGRDSDNDDDEGEKSGAARDQLRAIHAERRRRRRRRRRDGDDERNDAQVKSYHLQSLLASQCPEGLGTRGATFTKLNAQGSLRHVSRHLPAQGVIAAILRAHADGQDVTGSDSEHGSSVDDKDTSEDDWSHPTASSIEDCPVGTAACKFSGGAAPKSHRLPRGILEVTSPPKRMRSEGGARLPPPPPPPPPIFLRAGSTTAAAAPPAVLTSGAAPTRTANSRAPPTTSRALSCATVPSAAVAFTAVPPDDDDLPLSALSQRDGCGFSARTAAAAVAASIRVGSRLPAATSLVSPPSLLAATQMAPAPIRQLPSAGEVLSAAAAVVSSASSSIQSHRTSASAAPLQLPPLQAPTDARTQALMQLLADDEVEEEVGVGLTTAVPPLAPAPLAPPVHSAAVAASGIVAPRQLTVSLPPHSAVAAVTSVTAAGRMSRGPPPPPPLRASAEASGQSPALYCGTGVPVSSSRPVHPGFAAAAPAPPAPAPVPATAFSGTAISLAPTAILPLPQAAVRVSGAPAARAPSRQEVRARLLVTKGGLRTATAALLVAWVGDRSMSLLATTPPALIADAAVAAEKALSPLSPAESASLRAELLAALSDGVKRAVAV